jgi:hypothetical protein
MVLSVLNRGALRDAPDRVEGRDQIDRLGKVCRFGQERIGAKFVGFIDHCGCAVAREDDNRQTVQSGSLSDVLQHCKSAIARHNYVQHNQVGPGRRVTLVQFDQSIQVRNPLLCGIGDVPIERDFSVFARGLEKNLVVSAVVDMQHKQGRPLLANRNRFSFGLWW